MRLQRQHQHPDSNHPYHSTLFLLALRGLCQLEVHLGFRQHS